MIDMSDTAHPMTPFCRAICAARLMLGAACMKTRHALFLVTMVAGCSSGGGSTDGAIDAGLDSATDDGASDAPTDTGSCAQTGSATVVGTFVGNSLVPKDAIATEGPGLVIADFSGICALGQNRKANANELLFEFLGATAFTTGTVNVGNNLNVQYAQFDATCNATENEAATSGSVTITSVTSCGVVGTFDVTLNSDHVTGSFTAANCIPSVASLDGSTSCE